MSLTIIILLECLPARVFSKTKTLVCLTSLRDQSCQAILAVKSNSLHVSN